MIKNGILIALNLCPFIINFWVRKLNGDVINVNIRMYNFDHLRMYNCDNHKDYPSSYNIKLNIYSKAANHSSMEAAF